MMETKLSCYLYDMAWSSKKSDVCFYHDGQRYIYVSKLHCTSQMPV